MGLDLLYKIEKEEEEKERDSLVRFRAGEREGGTRMDEYSFEKTGKWRDE